MVYLVLRKQMESDLGDAEIWPHKVSDVFLLRAVYDTEERGCLIWYVDPSEVASRDPLRLKQNVHWIERPLAANYEEIGSRDINGRLLVQDPSRSLGPYILDLKPEEETTELWRDQKTFRGGHVSRLFEALKKEPRLEDCFVAGDKVPYNRFYYIGDPQELFEELRAEGFSFVD